MARSFERHLDKTYGPKRILSLSGGGVRGLVTLGALQNLEDALRKEMGGGTEVRLSDHYDLIAGTSTGSIIATGLALGWTVSQIKSLYDELCPLLFRPNNRLGVFRPKFDVKPLTDKLDEHLGDITLGSPELRTGLLICAKRMDTDSAWVLNNHPDGKFFGKLEAGQTWLPNSEYKLKYIVQASAAAPSFLEPVTITISEGSEGYAPETGVFVDGAISGHNCPAFAAFQVATLPPYGFDWDVGADKLSILSIGTGQYRIRKDSSEFLNQRTVNQAIDALKGMINESQRNTILTMQALSESRKAWRLNSEIEGLEGYMFGDEAMFRFRHVDVEIDNDTLRERLRMLKASGSKMDKITEAMRDMANGRKGNLLNCYRLGVAMGEDITADDLFL